MSERPWYRLHWVTWVAVVACGGFLVYLQVVPQLMEFEFNRPYPGMVKGWLRGWPILCFLGRGSSWWTLDRWLPFWGFSLNYVASLLVILSMVLVAEKLIRMVRKRLQFQISSLLVVTAVVAAVASVAQLPPSLLVELHVAEMMLLMGPAFEPYFFLFPNDYPWPIRIPLLILLGCTIYTTGWLAIRGVGFLIRKVRPAEKAA